MYPTIPFLYKCLPVTFRQTGIVGCYLIEKGVVREISGDIHQSYWHSVIRKLNDKFNIHEVLLSTSARNVLRGLHFQLCPMSTAKLVGCLSGEVFDAVVDLRKQSPTYLKTFTLRLSEDDNTMIFIPEGVAHGFYSFQDNSTIMYLTSGVFSQEHDSGILWNSAGIDWPVADPIISRRDQDLAPLNQFINPF